MSTPFAHLHADVRAMIALDDGKRIQALQRDRWIDYPRASEALQRLERLLSTPRVAHRLFASPVRRQFGGRDQCQGLRRRERKRQRSDTVHLERRHRQGERAMHAEIAGTLDARASSDSRSARECL